MANPEQFEHEREHLRTLMRDAPVKRADFARRRAQWRTWRSTFLRERMELLERHVVATRLATEVYEREQLCLGLELLSQGYDRRS